MPDNKENPGGDPKGQILRQLTSSIDEFVRLVSSEATKASNDDEGRAVVGATATTWSGQFAKLNQFMLEHYDRLNVGQRNEVDEFLRVQDGVALVNQGMSTAKQAFAAGWFKKFLKWMLKWHKEIKKVLHEIIQMITDALNISFPKWLETIFLLLDELFDAIMELLADVFGLDVQSFAANASQSEVEYLNQMEAVQRLRMVHSNARRTAEE